MKTNKCYRHIFTCVATLLLAVCSVSSATSSRWKNLTKISSSKSTKVTFHSESQYKRVCYLTVGKVLRPSQVNATLCTHINIGFARVQGSQLVPADADQVVFYKEVQRLKISNPDLKILISIGGSLSEAVATASNRTRLSNSIAKFLASYNFDGCDIDWEFPMASEKMLLSKFLQQLRMDVGNGHMVTLAVSPRPWQMEGYDIASMATYVDFVNVMCYDLHYFNATVLAGHPVENFTGHHSPLFARHADLNQKMNTKSSMERWLAAGMPKSKLVVGVGSYGRSFTLSDELKHGFGAAASGPGPHNWMQFSEICAMLKSGGTKIFDEQSQVPYAFKDNVWVGFDDLTSISHKCKWLKKNNYAGAMLWELVWDDPGASCDGNTKFPVATAIYRNL